MDAVKTGTYLALLRKTTGMTQQEVADRLGVSNKTISKWESGGGFPDITVLPALAELYHVAVDDILAGETLSDRRRAETAAETGAQKRRLLVRLRIRFDICFAMGLALAVIALFQIPYVSLGALPLSAALLWAGYVQTAHPIRCGDVDVDAAFWKNIYQKLLAAVLILWWGLTHMVHWGNREVDWSTGTIRYSSDSWMMLLLCAGIPVILWALSRGLRKNAGAEVKLLSKGWRRAVVWLLWGLAFFTVWRVADSRFDEVLAPWVERYGEDVLTVIQAEIQPKLRARLDAEIAPYLCARRIAAAAGILSGLGLAAGQLWSLRRERRDSEGKKPPEPTL
jgi:transcriptional regulator with XRE-family HTH domain